MKHLAAQASPPEVGATLQKLRLARGLTLDDLSRAAGVSKSMLSQIEREKANPTIAVAWRLSNALGVGIGELLSDESRAGACIPLMIRGRLIGALILESAKPGYWSDQHYEIMAQLSPWAALLVDNACRFNALWVVGSAEQRARVARDLHDNLGQSMAALEERYQWLLEAVAASDGGVVQLSGHRGHDGAENLPYQEGHALLEDGQLCTKEHFGYTDGIGDPYFAGLADASERVRGRGKQMDDGTWAPLATGEFLLGHI